MQSNGERRIHIGDRLKGHLALGTEDPGEFHIGDRLKGHLTLGTDKANDCSLVLTSSLHTPTKTSLSFSRFGSSHRL